MITQKVTEPQDKSILDSEIWKIPQNLETQSVLMGQQYWLHGRALLDMVETQVTTTYPEAEYAFEQDPHMIHMPIEV